MKFQVIVRRIIREDILRTVEANTKAEAMAEAMAEAPNVPNEQWEGYDCKYWHDEDDAREVPWLVP